MGKFALISDKNKVSPHIVVYKQQQSSFFSILNRISFIFLLFILCIFVYFFSDLYFFFVNFYVFYVFLNFVGFYIYSFAFVFIFFLFFYLFNSLKYFFLKYFVIVNKGKKATGFFFKDNQIIAFKKSLLNANFIFVKISKFIFFISICFSLVLVFFVF